MKNKIQEIQEWLKETKLSAFGGIRPSNAARNHFDWLIAEIKQARAEKWKLIKANGEVAILHIEAEARAKDLESVIKEMISVDDCQSRIYKQVKRVDNAEAEIKRLHGNLNKYTAAAEARIRELERVER